jgi:mannonate dehydratase
MKSRDVQGRPQRRSRQFGLRNARMLKIIDAKVIVTCPGRNFVTLKITTADGVHGIGDATLNGRELAVVSLSADHVIPA